MANKWMVIFNVIVMLIVFVWIFSLFIPSENYSSVTVAIVPIFGTISVGEISSGSLFSSGTVNSYDVVSQIEKANADPSVKYIVLDINSPGGSPVGSEEIMQAVNDSKKPVYAIIRDIGASGAYWIATGARKIFSSSISLVGGIGVTGSYVQASGFMSKYGFGYERLVSGEYKDTGTVFRNMTSDEKLMMTGKIMEINDYLVNSIAENRNLSVKYVKSLDNGEVFTGEEAVRNHLVDGLGTILDLKNEISKKENKSVVFVSFQKKPSLIERLLSSNSFFKNLLSSSISSALENYLNDQTKSDSVSLS